MPRMYRTLPYQGGDARDIAEVVNNAMNGKTNNSGTFTLATSATETIFYGQTPSINQVISIDLPAPTLSISSQIHYVWGSVVTVLNTGAATTYKLTSTGDIYIVQGRQIVSLSDQPSIDDNGEQELIWKEAQWLQVKPLATEIATNILASYKDPQNDVQLSLSNTGDPCLELGDKMTITDLYTDTDYSIVSTEISFNGGIDFKIRGRK